MTKKQLETFYNEVADLSDELRLGINFDDIFEPTKKRARKRKGSSKRRSLRR